ncbi:MAG TPA: hypothetical protein VNH15_07600 [Elusimicrobiota bacterium]|nr:hypothetical protein [Elusimicrobiota bacterium]
MVCSRIKNPRGGSGVKLAALLMAGSLLSGCTDELRLGQDFYQPPGGSPEASQSLAAAKRQEAAQAYFQGLGAQGAAVAQPPAAKVPLTVGLVKDDAPMAPLEGGHCLGYIGDAWVETSVEGDYQAAFAEALSQYFKSVIMIDGMRPQTRVDVIAKINRAFPEYVGLTLYDPASKAMLQDINEPFTTDSQHLLDQPCPPPALFGSALFFDLLGWDILFPVWAKFAEDSDYKGALGEMQANLSNAMSLASQRAAQSLARAAAPAQPPAEMQAPAAPAAAPKPWWEQQ